MPTPHDALGADDLADDVAMALTKAELSKLAWSLHRPANPEPRWDAGLSPPITPSVDPTLRFAAVGDVEMAGGRTVPGWVARARSQTMPPTPLARRHTAAGRATGTLTVGLLIAASTGAAAIAWTSYGGRTEQMVARWMPRQLAAMLLPPDNPELRAHSAPPAALPPDVELSAANKTPSQTGYSVQAESEAIATAPFPIEPAQALESMANDIASVRQEIEQLKTSQQRLSQNITLAFETMASARVSAQTPRTNASVQTSRVAPARAHRTTSTLLDADLGLVPRPPMPVR